MSEILAQRPFCRLFLLSVPRMTVRRHRHHHILTDHSGICFELYGTWLAPVTARVTKRVRSSATDDCVNTESHGSISFIHSVDDARGGSARRIRLRLLHSNRKPHNSDVHEMRPAGHRRRSIGTGLRRLRFGAHYDESRLPVVGKERHDVVDARFTGGRPGRGFGEILGRREQ